MDKISNSLSRRPLVAGTFDIVPAATRFVTLHAQSGGVPCGKVILKPHGAARPTRVANTYNAQVKLYRPSPPIQGRQIGR